MILSVKELCKIYFQGSDKIVALDHVSFSMAKGETLAIVGPSGSGKTTLLSLLAGLEEASSGSICLDNQEILSLSEEELTQFRAKHIGFIFQQFHLMPHLTALENVRLPLDIQRIPKAEILAQEALNSVGLLARKSHFPLQLSGGECQRVAIARAIVTQPSILFADEPTGNLDTDNGQIVMDLIFKLVKDYQMTLVVVTHNWDIAQACDRHIALKGGIIDQAN